MSQWVEHSRIDLMVIVKDLSRNMVGWSLPVLRAMGIDVLISIRRDRLNSDLIDSCQATDRPK